MNYWLLNMTWQQAFELSTKLVALVSILQALEFLAIRRQYQLHRWPLPAGLKLALGNLGDVIAGHWMHRLILTAMILCGMMVIVPVPMAATKWFLGALLILRMSWNLWNRSSLLGSDQMAVIVMAACFAYQFALDPLSQRLCAWFVCLQLVLAYCTAGIYKAASPAWRAGSAVRDILRTTTWGSRSSFKLISRVPWLSWTLCWATIIFEIVFPFAIFLGPGPTLVFLACGIGFHLGIALTIGLNDFVLAYAASYPIVLRCSIDVQRWLERQ